MIIQTMKALTYILVLACFIAKAQSPEDIVNQFIKITGMNDSIFSIQLHFEGKNNDKYITQTRNNQLKKRIKYQNNGNTATVYNKGEAWKYFYNDSKENPKTIFGEETRILLKDQARDFYSSLLNYKEKKYSIKRLNDVEKEGETCFYIKLIKPPVIINSLRVNPIEHYYISKKTYLPVLKEYKVLGSFFNGKIRQHFYSDYKKNQGVFFPYKETIKIKTGEGAILTYMLKEVSLNVIIEDDFFTY